MQKSLNKRGVPRMENPPPRPLNLSTEDIQLVEELASYFFTPREIAVMVEVDPEAFIYAIDYPEGSQIATAFLKGRLQNEMELRKSIIKLAKAGSSPAQTMSLDLLNKSRVKMMEK